MSNDSGAGMFLKVGILVAVLSYFFWEVPIVKILAGVYLVGIAMMYSLINICIMLGKMLFGIPI